MRDAAKHAPAVAVAATAPGAAGAHVNANPGRGLHSFTLLVELNLSKSRTESWVELGYTVDRRAQVELKSERV